jgi:hypothetical protein
MSKPVKQHKKSLCLAQPAGQRLSIVETGAALLELSSPQQEIKPGIDSTRRRASLVNRSQCFLFPSIESAAFIGWNGSIYSRASML